MQAAGDDESGDRKTKQNKPKHYNRSSRIAELNIGVALGPGMSIQSRMIHWLKSMVKTSFIGFNLAMVAPFVFNSEPESF